MTRPTFAFAFKSTPEFWALERHGFKPNTVRIMDAAEAEIAMEGSYAIAFAGPVQIRVVNTATGTAFARTLTDISIVGELLGKSIVVFSWRHEDVQS